jgi:hypothetical protein
VPSSWDRPKRIAIGIAIIGIVIEVVAVMLLASKRIPTTFGTPLVVTGMLLAFVPIFYMARQRRRR